MGYTHSLEFKKVKHSGFTLIELLIVIVILAVLASVLISIINPKKQQNTANDATIKSTIVKVALSTEGFVSSYSRTPNDEEFLSSLEATVTGMNNTCGGTATPDKECLFSVSSINLPNTCNADGWTGLATSTGPCFFRYYAGPDIPGNSTGANHFRIYAKSFGFPDSIFVYDNDSGGAIRYCPYDLLDNQPVLTACEI